MRWDLWLLVAIGLAVLVYGIATDQALPAILIAAVLIGGQAWTYGKSRIEVDRDDVTVRSVPGRSQRCRRSDVKTIQIFSYWKVLRDPQGQTLVRMRPYWSRSQLQELADALAVPLIDRRKWRGVADK